MPPPEIATAFTTRFSWVDGYGVDSVYESKLIPVLAGGCRVVRIP